MKEVKVKSIKMQTKRLNFSIHKNTYSNILFFMLTLNVKMYRINFTGQSFVFEKWTSQRNTINNLFSYFFNQSTAILLGIKLYSLRLRLYYMVENTRITNIVCISIQHMWNNLSLLKYVGTTHNCTPSNNPKKTQKENFKKYKT